VRAARRTLLFYGLLLGAVMPACAQRGIDEGITARVRDDLAQRAQHACGDVVGDGDVRMVGLRGRHRVRPAAASGNLLF